jgi:hypothetical protein
MVKGNMEGINPGEIASFLDAVNTVGNFEPLKDFGELKTIQPTTDMMEKPSKIVNNPFHLYTPLDYLNHIESSIPRGLISQQNYNEIKTLASFFKCNITSFFGFETRLNKKDGRVDYLFAISKKNNEREEFLRLFDNNTLPSQFMKNQKWMQIEKFARKWTDKSSILYDKILGLWLEFDTSNVTREIPVPGLFFQIKPIRKDKSKTQEDYSWITDILIPASTGKEMNYKNKQKMLQSIENLPEGSLLLHVAAMISRDSSIIRTTIKMKPEQIIPYLTSLGWNDENDGLSKLVNSIQEYTTRIILHISIDDEINPKIGLECSFSPDLYHQEKRWEKLFDYLIQQGACLPQKKDLVLSANGISQEEPCEDFQLFTPVVQLDSTISPKALVRYLSHIKIQYTPNEPFIAKAYPGVRLFGKKTGDDIQI